MGFSLALPDDQVIRKMKTGDLIILVFVFNLICLFIRHFACLCVCLSVCLSFRLSVCQFHLLKHKLYVTFLTLNTRNLVSSALV